MNKILQSTSYCTIVNFSIVVFTLQYGDYRISALNKTEKSMNKSTVIDYKCWFDISNIMCIPVKKEVFRSFSFVKIATLQCKNTSKCS